MRTRPERPPTRTGGSSPGNCEVCGRRIQPGQGFDIVVPDSSVAHPTDPTRDGRRQAHACSAIHAGELVQIGARNWVDEELWAAQIGRLSAGWNYTALSLDEVAAIAGLDRTQLRRALSWRVGAISAALASSR